MSFIARAFGILAVGSLAACAYEPEQAATDKVLKEVLSGKDPLASVGRYLPITQNGIEVGVLRISGIIQNNSELCAQYDVVTLESSNRAPRIIAQDLHRRCLSEITP